MARIGFAEERPWSFEPLGAQNLPAVSQEAWPRTRLDHFILAKLESKGLQPSSPADDRTRIRRLQFDLIGLPPTPDQFAAALQIPHPELVDQLLASPHYGERWARHWLDLTRYTDVTASWLKLADSAYHYRDWVVQALNDDLPYDQFVIRQLATDLLPETPPEDNAALGFLGLSPAYWKELQLPPEIIKTTVADEWEEHIDALGRTFLGLTLACARCHDHKSDPVSTADYYAIAGVFASVQVTDVPTITSDLYQPVAAAKAKVAALEKERADLKKKTPKPEDLEGQLAELANQISAIKKATPHYNVPMVNAVKDAALYVKPKEGGFGTMLSYRPGEARDLQIQHRGNPNDTGETVPRRFLSAFPSEDGEPRRLQSGSGRLELARAMVEDARALTARVIVNRVWKQHFGRGLVNTPSDFGFMGDPPTHPELLDDLAFHFVQNGWSLKWLHREILNSATWQQRSVSPESEAKDPENHLFSRMNRRRLEIEAWRDAMLFVSGDQDLKTGGPSLDLDSTGNHRRSIYGKIHRRELNNLLQVHDFPDPAAHSPARTQTTSPLQMLFSLNGPLVMGQAKKLAQRVEKTNQPIPEMYALLFQRQATEEELELGRNFLASRADAWPFYAQALLASNEFLYVD